jgi:ADP-ribose pyrophosphatase YjhB (NUDIX family)
MPRVVGASAGARLGHGGGYEIEMKTNPQRTKAGLNLMIQSAGAVCFRRGKDSLRLLLVQTQNQHFWTLPKGKCEPGETFQRTALRELQEEAGVLGQIKGDISWRVSRERLNTEIVYYLVESTQEKKTRHGKRKIGWFTLDEANSVLQKRMARRKVEDGPYIGELLKVVGEATLAIAGHHRVFISHAADDRPVADALVQILTSRFGIHRSLIRCTSVQDCGLRGGDTWQAQVRTDLANAEHFIVLLTPKSRTNLNVMCEAGARWGQEKKVIPVLAADTPSAALPSLLAHFHAIKWKEETAFIAELKRAFELS